MSDGAEFWQQAQQDEQEQWELENEQARNTGSVDKTIRGKSNIVESGRNKQRQNQSDTVSLH